MYSPNFSLTSASVNLIAEISSLAERFDLRLEREDSLRLRRASRIQSVHSSLAIEGNTLSESQVRDILDGKPVIGPKREIEEAGNALKVYEECASFDPFSLKDLLCAHGIMMKGLLPDAGHIRSGGVGVIAGKKVMHLAPPARRVCSLLEDLFGWVKSAPDHILVKSSVFHYEFEFIHPFSDGNGRMGRFWQMLLLASWKSLFAQLPIENIVRAHQRDYYDAIIKSTHENDSGIFVEFMLNGICEAMKSHIANFNSAIGNDVVNDAVNDVVKSILSFVISHPRATYGQIAEGVGKSTATVCRGLSELKKLGIIERIGADKNGSWRYKPDGGKK